MHAGPGLMQFNASLHPLCSAVDRPPDAAGRSKFRSPDHHPQPCQSSFLPFSAPPKCSFPLPAKKFQPLAPLLTPSRGAAGAASPLRRPALPIGSARRLAPPRGRLPGCNERFFEARQEGNDPNANKKPNNPRNIAAGPRRRLQMLSVEANPSRPRRPCQFFSGPQRLQALDFLLPLPQISVAAQDVKSTNASVAKSKRHCPCEEAGGKFGAERAACQAL
jgi:hypothetical protein